MVGEWFDVRNIPVELFQMSRGAGGFSSPPLRDRQNTLAIRTVLSMLTSPDEVTRKLMKQFEKKQARNCDIEYKKHEADCTACFLNWNPSLEQMDITLTSALTPFSRERSRHIRKIEVRSGYTMVNNSCS
jgi:hypothetical protein